MNADLSYFRRIIDLSFEQSRLWFLLMTKGGGCFYVVNVQTQRQNKLANVKLIRVKIL